MVLAAGETSEGITDQDLKTQVARGKQFCDLCVCVHVCVGGGGVRFNYTSKHPLN